MIQRIQSVYLLVVTILLVVTMCQPVGSFIAAGRWDERIGIQAAGSDFG